MLGETGLGDRLERHASKMGNRQGDRLRDRLGAYILLPFFPEGRFFFALGKGGGPGGLQCLIDESG